MSRKQSLKQALKLAAIGGNDIARAAFTLVGCPEGGWGETRQAMRQIGDLLPAKETRSYSIDEFVSAAYTIDHAGRYRSRVGA